MVDIWHRHSTGSSNTDSQYRYGYDDAGNRTNMVGTAGSAVRSESYSYDAQDQLIGVTYKTGSVTERIVSYRYDAAGNRTGMVERVGGATNTTTYTANSDNQLTSATATRQGLTVTGYVEPGPRSNKWYASTATARGVSAAVSQQNGSFAIPGVPVTGGANALTVAVTDVSGNIATQVVNVTIATAATTLGYDANGNQTNDAIWAFSYDRENRLVSATSASLAVNYVYDPLGRLIERRTSGSSVTTNRMYYAGQQLVAEYDGAGALQRKYVYGSGIDEPVRMTASGTNYYYHADGLGSVTEVTDNTGSIIERYSYDVYGKPTFFDSSFIPQPSSLVSNRLLFTGRDLDPDTGWYNYRHRYYNPMLGRFVQPDPIDLEGGDLNLYRYVRNNPVLLVDALGLERDWNQLQWWQKLEQGYYYGTGYGVSALDWYADVSTDPNAPWYAKTGAAIGGSFSALWTPEKYQRTGWTLVCAYGLRGTGVRETLADGSRYVRGIDYGDLLRVEKHWIGKGATRLYKWHVDALGKLIRHWPWGV